MDLQNTFLVIDTETGGLDPGKCSLLSIAGVVWGPDLPPQNLFSFFIREDNLSIEPGAIEVNKINLNEVISKGLTPSKACLEIQTKLAQFFNPNNDTNLPQEPILLAGHNVGFDIAYLKRLFRLGNSNVYSKLFSHRSLDTASVLKFLQLMGHIPSGKVSSDVLFQFCGVEIPPEHRHTALGDAVGTAASLDFLLKKFKLQ